MQGEPLPIVAIVGRPNVGKSTLFNRYAGSRRALVHDEPGITRDRIAEEVEAGDRRVLLVDTAGLAPRGKGGKAGGKSQRGGRHGEPELEGAIQAQAREAIGEADAVLFVVDGRAGVLPDDEVLARVLHRASKPITLVVNKIDGPRDEPLVAEFHRLGFARVRGVSAEHAGGAWDALEEIVADLPPRPERQECAERGDEEELRVAVVGRPNVGKSSLVNRLVGEERVVVSEVPGTTRDAIDTRVEVDGQPFRLIDTAGLRGPGRRTRTVERGSALMTTRAIERADVAVVVIDASEGCTDRDAAIANLARERGCATIILANKWDLVARADSGAEGAAEEVLRAIGRGLRFMSDAPVLRVSAKTGAGVARILPLTVEVARAGERRIGTAELNRWLRDAVQRHEPAMAQRGTRRRALKFFYATQTSVRPPTIVLFCTDPKAVQPSYRRFLENRLRESFDLRGTPVRLRLRPRASDG